MDRKPTLDATTAPATKPDAEPALMTRLWRKITGFLRGRKRGKQFFDLFVFSLGVAIIYKFGQLLAQEIEKMHPTEDSVKSIL